MAKLVGLQSKGGEVLFAVTAPGEDVRAVSYLGDKIDSLEENLDGAFRVLQTIAKGLNDVLAKSPVQQAEVELGLQLSGKGQLFVVQGSAEATLKVKLVISPKKAS